MTTYRTGGCWGRTIVRVGIQPPDERGKRPDDEVVGLMDTPKLAEQAVNGGLNAGELLERFTVDVLSGEVGVICNRCRWDWIFNPCDPPALAELVRRAGEHAEVCG